MADLQKKRNEIDPQFQWRLNDLFIDNEEWQKKYDEVLSQISKFEIYKNTFTNSAASLLECLSNKDSISNLTSKLFVYAKMKLDENSIDSVSQALWDKAEHLAVRVSSSLSFIEPELLILLNEDDEKLSKYKEKEPGLNIYSHMFNDLLRQKKHVLTAELEELLADAGEIGSAPETIFNMLNNADLKFGIVHNEKGEEIELTHSRYGTLIESYDRNVRREAFKALYAAYDKQKNTLAATYNSSVKKDIFFAKARNYNSALEAALMQDNIPTSVYHNLIEGVHQALPQLHRYMRLRKKTLEISELHMYDIHTPIVPKVNDNSTYEEAKKHVLAAVVPMGEDYVSTVSDAFKNGWIDVYENEGKRSGAYSWGAFGCHPYMLLNFENKIDDTFTVAHEMGHSLHSHYSWNNQPFVYADYTIFLAEVASTVNEALLMDYLRKNVTDKKMYAYLINYFLEQFRGTVFRQTMFAEFEMITHEMAENGQPLTLESLCNVYRELNKKYYGPDLIIDTQIDLEWARIPHFYSAFYVFQYATGFSAAIAFSRRILQGDKNAVEAYKNFLKSGSSDYSISILRKAGLDMESTTPVSEALKLFSELLDEIENLV